MSEAAIETPVDSCERRAFVAGREPGQLVFRIDGDDAEDLAADCVISLPRGSWMRFELASGGSWYGHGFAHRQPYPLNVEVIVNPRFAVNNIQSPIWMCSSGYALLANTVEELEVRCNDAENGWLEIRCKAVPIHVQVFRGRDLTEAHRKLMVFLQWPPPAPEKDLLGDSIFCTWTQYPRAITQERVLEMARAIRERRFPCSVITIDDRWESTVGELRFSSDFPDPGQMVKELHALGFRVLLWVTPFVDCGAATFAPLAENGLLARAKDGNAPSLLKWWGGTAGIIDITNPVASDWFRAQLFRLKNEIGVDGFKIDGGDAKYQPDIDKTTWLKNAGPSGYIDLLLALFEEVAPGMCESRTAWLSQKRNILWREGGKDSHWGLDNGLQAMVSLGLHLALLGYDLLIPDMIPGRIQTLVSTLPLPSDELFIRWVEASALMPVMQFSYLPWNYSEATSTIAQRYAELHKALEEYLHEQAHNRRRPLLRPLWYDSPEVPELYAVVDEFLLGNDILAAPVMKENQTERDIVLPPGEWFDAWSGRTHLQGTLFDHTAPCPGIPLFVRAGRPELFAVLHRILNTIERGSVLSGVTSATYTCGLDRDIGVSG
ncbi:MAG: glycoside hydrolase family 31 protein [Verrucomicrobiota bacterium]